MKTKIDKVLIWIAMLLLAYCLFDTISHAEPFVAWDANDLVEVIGYQVEINGSVIDVDPTVVNNTSRCIYDLVTIPVGASTLRARMKTKFWPWTEWSEPYIVIRPSPLANPQIISNPQ